MQNGHLSQLSSQDSLLNAQYPLLEHLQIQRELLYAHSRPVKKPLQPDGENYLGNFGSGVIELILDEIDGEPNSFYGHMETPSQETQLNFIVQGIDNEALDQLIPGKKYKLSWLETVMNMEPFDDSMYRCFVAYRIEEK